jgi:H+/Cl- antiporter ClcA
MTYRWDFREHWRLAVFVGKWFAISIPLGILIGSAVGLFLWSLDRVTELQWNYPWLLYLLPLAGLGSGWVYHCWGQNSEGGNNLIIDEIHQPGGGGGGVPARMAPMVLLGTLLTHLFGGSAGREGTAVQMGGSLASSLSRWLKLGGGDNQILLSAGVAAGFGAVFGTPLAGSIFALEVLAIGAISYRALIPALMSAVIADQVTQIWGIGHTHYHIAFGEGISAASNDSLPVLDGWLLAKVSLAAVCFGLASVFFVELTHFVSRIFKRLISRPWLRPAIGGLVVVLLVWLTGTRDYLGLGVIGNPRHPEAVSITSSFQPDGAGWFSWFWKSVFTAVTVGSGFKGGEVTPLFFVGASLGCVLGQLLNAPVDLLASLGFVAVFCGATNTPLACTIMAIELFAPFSDGLLSSGFVVYAAVACFLAYFLSGHSKIYASQRIGQHKIDP